jgi:hypothetical protein
MSRLLSHAELENLHRNAAFARREAMAQFASNGASAVLKTILALPHALAVSASAFRKELAAAVH